ncbi:DUF4192 family protein [Nocardia sp. NPDC004860]|uniref:DUF4192 family protein n=1 Tax=Nocardia sp. NPDC004860 TaxID=3154557 RepID=UPI0033B15C49
METILIDNVPDLIASLPAQLYGEDIPARALVTLLVRRMPEGHWSVEHIQATALSFCACCTVTGEIDPWEVIGPHMGTGVVAVVIDDEADGGGDSGQEHGELLDKLASALGRLGVTLEASYAARATAPGHPVWSLDTEEFAGHVPLAPPGPDGHRYALAADIVAQPENSLARLATN